MSEEIEKEKLDEKVVEEQKESQEEIQEDSAVEITEDALEVLEPVDEFEALQKEKDELYDKHLRLAAEYDNFRKRTLKEKNEYHKYAVTGLLEKMIPILDTLERGIASNEKADSVEPVKEGFEKVYALFKDILNKEGLEAIDQKGVLVDYNCHMAVFQEENNEVYDGTVLEIFEKGYKLKDKVIKVAKVKVAKSDKEAPKKESIDEKVTKVDFKA
ncbi:MAG: nucleotide exchange factor GrpE [Candidatus Cloacimonadota bacterium]|nr:MAG: nucleotide exchange factor GrpE [Candidatus Cloacimonadota bacterium]